MADGQEPFRPPLETWCNAVCSVLCAIVTMWIVEYCACVLVSWLLAEE